MENTNKEKNRTEETCDLDQVLTTTLRKIFEDDIYIYYNPVFQNQFLEELLKHDKSYKQLLDLSLSEMPWIKYRIKELFHSGKIDQKKAFEIIKIHALSGDSFYKKFLSEILAYGCSSFPPDIMGLLGLRELKWEEAIHTTLPRKIGENYWEQFKNEIKDLTSIKYDYFPNLENKFTYESTTPNWLTREQLFKVLLGQYTPSFKIDKKEIMRDIEDEYRRQNEKIYAFNHYLFDLAEKGLESAQDLIIEGLYRGCFGFEQNKEKAMQLIEKYNRMEFWEKFL